MLTPSLPRSLADLLMVFSPCFTPADLPDLPILSVFCQMQRLTTPQTSHRHPRDVALSSLAARRPAHSSSVTLRDRR